MENRYGFRRRLRDIRGALLFPILPLRYLSWRKIFNYYRTQIAWLWAFEKTSARPYQLTLELTNICNLHCPKCPTGQGRWGRKPTMLSLERLDEILDELGPYAFQIDLHNWGESLLHKKAFEAIRHCEDRRVMTTICTNFNIRFDDQRAEEMVKSGLSILSVSIDGGDQETYATYRVGGSLTRVLENVDTLRRAKERLGSATPIILWNYLLFRYNQHLVEEARSLAQAHGMAFHVARGYGYGDDEYETTTDVQHPVAGMLMSGPACRWLYSMVVVNADQGISPCCFHEAFDSSTDFGRIDDQTFSEVWGGASYVSARRLFKNLLGRGQPPSKETVCQRCPVYEHRVTPEKFPQLRLADRKG